MYHKVPCKRPLLGKNPPTLLKSIMHIVSAYLYTESDFQLVKVANCDELRCHSKGKSSSRIVNYCHSLQIYSENSEGAMRSV